MARHTGDDTDFAWRKPLTVFSASAAPEGYQLSGSALTSGPYNFNGLDAAITSSNVNPNQRDIQVNLLSRHDRKAQGATGDRRDDWCVRQSDGKIAASFGRRIKVAEVPPGPPVLQTLVAEVYVARLQAGN